MNTLTNVSASSTWAGRYAPLALGMALTLVLSSWPEVLRWITSGLDLSNAGRIAAELVSAGLLGLCAAAAMGLLLLRWAVHPWLVVLCGLGVMAGAAALAVSASVFVRPETYWLMFGSAGAIGGALGLGYVIADESISIRWFAAGMVLAGLMALGLDLLGRSWIERAYVATAIGAMLVIAGVVRALKNRSPDSRAASAPSTEWAGVDAPIRFAADAATGLLVLAPLVWMVLMFDWPATGSGAALLSVLGVALLALCAMGNRARSVSAEGALACAVGIALAGLFVCAEIEVPVLRLAGAGVWALGASWVCVSGAHQRSAPASSPWPRFGSILIVLVTSVLSTVWFGRLFDQQRLTSLQQQMEQGGTVALVRAHEAALSAVLYQAAVAGLVLLALCAGLWFMRFRSGGRS